MRIVKTHGRSVVVRDNNKLTRKLIPKAKARQGEREAETDIHAYLSQNEKFFLAQWGSILDKMLTKPSPNAKKEEKIPYQLVYEARQKVADAFMALWEGKNEFEHINCESSAFYNEWIKYVHP